MEIDDQKLKTSLEYFKGVTGKISPASPESVEEIGQRIRIIREEKGLSLDQLSNMTGFEVELLSDIESNKFQPQLGTLIKLAKALDSAFGRLVSGVGDKLYSITRKDERKVISRSTSQKAKQQVYTYRSLAPEVKGRHMEALIVQLEENPDGEKSVHEGEELIYVLDGNVSLILADESFELEPGDSVYYLSTIPHLIAAKEGQATLLAVLYEG